MKHKYDFLPDLLRRRVLQAYITLQVVFTARYSQLEHSLLKNLYEILNIYILQSNKPELISVSWFTITNTKTAKFHYFFSRERLEYMLKILIKHQVRELSPFELATCLITDEATDTFWELGIITNKEFVSLPFIQLSSVIQEHKHWVAESNLYQEANISAKEICIFRDCCLLINCPTQNSPELEKIVTFAIPDLSDQFQKNLKEYSTFRKAIAKLAHPMRHSGTYEALKDFTSDVISKTIGEIMKP